MKIESSKQSVKNAFFCCPFHNSKYIYVCTEPDCPSALACGNASCLDRHFHDGVQMHFTRLNSEQINSKLDAVAESSNLLLESASQVKLQVSELDQAAGALLLETKAYHQCCLKLRREFQESFNTLCLRNLQEIQHMQGTIEERLHSLRTKIRVQQREVKEVSPNAKTIQFLMGEHPSWKTPTLLYSSLKDSLTVERFHERLHGRRGLLFLMRSNGKQILGSYYDCPYPSPAESTRKDEKSFLFYAESEGEYYKYMAMKGVESHITVSERLMICHGNTPSLADGIFSFQRDYINYYLPSSTYEGSVEQSGSLIISEITVYQTT